MKRAYLIALASGLSIAAISRTAAADEPARVMFNPADIKWGDAPPALSPGAKAAVLYGDPGKPGLFVIRLKCRPVTSCRRTGIRTMKSSAW